jgi:hypothetical protein
MPYIVRLGSFAVVAATLVKALELFGAMASEGNEDKTWMVARSILKGFAPRSRTNRSCAAFGPRVAIAVIALLAAGPAAFSQPVRLTGDGIAAQLDGMQVTDESHYRLVFARGGTLRSFAMGATKVGRWSIEGDEICLHLGGMYDGCYSVRLDGDNVEMTPWSVGEPLDGLLRPADP